MTIEEKKKTAFMSLTYAHSCSQTDNPFRRTIQYAISLGGDTDTIANMAGAIAGAYYGYGSISDNLQDHCEAIEQFTEYADKLHKITVSE